MLILWPLKVCLFVRGQGSTNSIQYPTKIPNQIKLPKKILAKFSYPKTPEIEDFKPKKSFDHPRHLKSQVPPWV